MLCREKSPFSASVTDSGTQQYRTAQPRHRSGRYAFNFGQSVYLLTVIAGFIVCISCTHQEDDPVILITHKKWNFQRICRQLF
jgi:hypothetical protein